MEPGTPRSGLGLPWCLFPSVSSVHDLSFYFILVVFFHTCTSPSSVSQHAVSKVWDMWLRKSCRVLHHVPTP